MPAAEVLEWQAFFTIEPFGPVRDNYHSAQIAHILANSNRRPNSPEIPMSNFFYLDPEERRRRKDQAMLKMFQSKARNKGEQK